MQIKKVLNATQATLSAGNTFTIQVYFIAFVYVEHLHL